MIRVLIIFIFISCSSGESDSELINPVEQNDLLKSDYIYRRFQNQIPLRRRNLHCYRKRSMPTHRKFLTQTFK